MLLIVTGMLVYNYTRIKKGGVKFPGGVVSTMCTGTIVENILVLTCSTTNAIHFVVTVNKL